MIFAAYYSRMNKDMHKIRLANLQKLIESHDPDPGNRAAFCRAYGLDPLQVGQYFTGGDNGRNIGERKARAIEQAVGLENGWMDQSSNESAKTNFKSIATTTPPMPLIYVDFEELELLTHLRQSTPAGREILINFAKTVEKDHSKLKKLSKVAR